MNIQEDIKNRLQQIESKENIQILYACESGSRAWGFASPDSDYDARFIYMRPRNWYLGIEDRSETLDYALDGDLDFRGWDIRKVLKMIRKTNATPLEWLQSPIIYRSNPALQAELLDLVNAYFSPRPLVHHYLGLAKSSLISGLQGQEVINIKKYFYVLRPLLAAVWVVDKQAIPPMEFAPLLSVIDQNSPILPLILDLVERKKLAKEGDTTPLIPELQQFIDAEFKRCDEAVSGREPLFLESAKLDSFFRKLLGILD